MFTAVCWFYFATFNITNKIKCYTFVYIFIYVFIYYSLYWNFRCAVLTHYAWLLICTYTDTHTHKIQNGVVPSFNLSTLAYVCICELTFQNKNLVHTAQNSSVKFLAVFVMHRNRINWKIETLTNENSH